MAGKADIISSIADAAGITKKEAGAAYDALIDHIRKSMKRGDRCAVPGLGTFSVSSRKARQGRNPATGQPMKISASKNVKFKAGKDLRESVNKKKPLKK